MKTQLIPKIIYILTGHERYPVSIKWVKGNWTHNVFRLWEKIAWRRSGIRCEMSLVAQLQKNGTHEFLFKFYTLEALLSHIEGRIRMLLRLETVKEVFQFPAYQFQRGAIAFGSNSTNGSITPSGSDRMLIAGIFNIASDIGAVSFGGTACNQIDTANLGVNRDGYVYMLKAPATSSNSLANVGAANYTLYYYTGVIQNDTAGTVDGRTETTGTSSSPSGSHTAVASGAWTWCTIFVNDQTVTASGWTNMANKTGQTSPSSATLDSGDTGEASGSETQSESLTGSSAWYVQQTSMAPVASATATFVPRRMLMGMG